MQQTDGNQPNPWTLIQKNDKFDCPYFTVHSDTVTHRGGKQRSYNHIHMKNFGVAVVPIDNDGSTTLIGQYRFPLDRFTWEVTRGGGGRDVPAINSAKRELREEQVTVPIIGWNSLLLPLPLGQPTLLHRVLSLGDFTEANLIQTRKS